MYDTEFFENVLKIFGSMWAKCTMNLDFNILYFSTEFFKNVLKILCSMWVKYTMNIDFNYIVF